VKITANKPNRLQLEKWTKCHLWLFGRDGSLGLAAMWGEFGRFERC
jgi:hypothetical protein